MNIIKEEYYDKDLYEIQDLHDIADNTSRKEEINDYLFDYKYNKDDDYDIEI